MHDLNPQAQLSFLKNMFHIISHKEDTKVTRQLFVSMNTNKDSEKRIPGKMSTWLNSSSSQMKIADSKSEVSLDNKSPSHFSFEF